jgi:hypothetical protein
LELLGCLVTLLAAAAPIVEVPRPGLDEGWRAGLQLARLSSIKFGDPLIFTYGPLGFLDTPAYPDPVLVVSIALVSVATLAALFWTVQSSLVVWTGRERSVLIATLSAAALGPWLTPSEKVTLICMVLGLRAVTVSGTAAQRRIALFMTVATAVMLLVKVSEGVVLAGLTLVVVASAGRRVGHRLLMCLPLGVGVFALTWVATGQSMAVLSDWAKGVLSIIGGYAGAMSDEVPDYFWVVATYVVAVAVAGRAIQLHGARLVAQRSLRTTLSLIYLALIVGFLSRQGFVRHDEGHAAFTFAICLVLLISAPRRGRPTPLDVALLVLSVVLGSPVSYLLGLDGISVVAAAVTFAVLMLVLGSGVIRRRESVGNGDSRLLFAGLSVALLLTLASFQPWNRMLVADQVVRSDAQRESMLERGRAADRDIYALSEPVLRSLRGRPLTVDPWEVSLAFAYELHWQPLPVLQSYSAYTAYLDELNTRALLSDPDRIVLRQSPRRLLKPLDGRNPLWDSPRYNVALLCHFKPMAGDDIWLSLAPGNDRCAPPRDLGATDAAAGMTIEVPRHGADQLVLATVTPDSPSVWRAVSSAVLKDPQVLEVSVDGQAYRLPTALGGSPLVLNVPDSLGWPTEFGGGADAQSLSVSEASRVTFTVVDIAAVEGSGS